MNIYPAIDIKGGKCVRLYQGDYQQETIYHTNPVEVAKKFIADGARLLHIVDLDGAQTPDMNQSTIIESILNIGNINVQLGGGIRTEVQIKRLLDQGTTRVIIGSMAILNKCDVYDWFKTFGPDKLVLALDIKKDNRQVPRIAINGWQSISEYALTDIINYYLPVGLKHLLCTNIDLDGTLNGPDYVLYESILSNYPTLDLQASGGIHSLSDINILANKGLNGAIIGRALYENKFNLVEVLAC